MELEYELEFLEERLKLADTRIGEIAQEGLGYALTKAKAEDAETVRGLDEYYHRMAEFLLLVNENRGFVAKGGLKKASLEELGKRNHALYEDVLPENYDKSFGNPDYAAARLGEGYGRLLSFLHVELFSTIECAYVGMLEDLVIREELFVETYGVFEASLREEGVLPSVESIRQILYPDHREDQEEPRGLEEGI